MNVSVFCFLASYAVALGCEIYRSRTSGDAARRVTLLAGLAGLVAHTFYLFNRAAETDLPPLLSSTADWLLVITWMAMALFLVLEFTQRKLPLGLFVLPPVLVVSAAVYFAGEATTIPNAADAHERARSGWAMLHASFLATGSAGVLVSFVVSLMYLIQHRRLKSAQPANNVRLPNLERLSAWNWWAVIVSVPLLTFGMVTGFVLMGLSETEPVGLTDPLVLISSTAWAGLFGLFLWLARREHPRGKFAAWMTIAACSAMLATLLGLQLITGGGRPHGATAVFPEATQGAA